jgi:lysine 2,3-aminomutase
MVVDSLPAASVRHPIWKDVPDHLWGDWKWQLRHRVSSLAQLEGLLELTPSERRGIQQRSGEFPMAITPHYLSLMGGPDCAVRRQGVPHEDELVRLPWDMDDPLAEDEHSPVECLSHRYPDRALLYVSHNCPVYCRHCTRQRKVGDARSAPSLAVLEAAFAYLRATPAVRDVLVSGGDPLSLSDARLVSIVARLREIPSIEIIRLCTRNPVTLPQRLTPELLDALRPHHPIFISTHFNHPRECSVEAAACLERLADSGFVISNQSVLLREINDDTEALDTLSRWLLRHRCRPYYLFQCDQVAGTAHLRTSVERSLEVVDGLRGTLSGLGVPQYAIDLPGGGGKVILSPDRLVGREGARWTFRDHRGDEYTFNDPSTTGIHGRDDAAAPPAAPTQDGAASAKEPEASAKGTRFRASKRLPVIPTNA